MTEMYDQLARFYDREYGEKRDDLAFYHQIADQSGGPILEIGVGTGRLAIPLVQAGHSVVGIDPSLPMLDVARKNRAALSSVEQQRLSLVPQRMADLELDADFPLCLIPFRAFLHNLTLNEQVAALERIAAHLQPQGLLVFDLFVPLYSVIAQQNWGDKWDEVDLSPGLRLATEVRHDPVEQRLSVHNRYLRKRRNRWTEVGEGSYVYRYVFRFEMEALLRLTGFRVLEVFGGFDRQTYDFHSGLMVFIAQKQ